MTLSPEFRHADRIGKHLPGHHNQQSHGNHVFQGLMRGLDAPKGPDQVDMREPRERKPLVRERPMGPNDPLTKPNMSNDALRHEISSLQIGTPIRIVGRKKRGQQWYRIETEVAYLGWADADHIKVARLPYRAGGQVQRAPYRSVRLGIQKWYVPTPELVELDDEGLVEKKEAVDGDGDGWVYEGTPKKRPATPKERAAGIAARAKKGGVAAPAKKGAAKKAAANPKAARIARFERAIVAAKSPQDKKRVLALIEQDFVLDKPEREALKARLNGGAAPNPKKVAAKKPAPKKDLAADPELPPSVADAKAQAQAAADKDVAEGKRPAKKAAAKKPGPVTRAHEKLREAGLSIPAPKGQATKDREAAADAAAALVDKIKAAKDQGDLDAMKNGIMAPTKALLRKHPDLVRLVNAAFKVKRDNLRDTHGPKTKAWQRLWNRDLGRAKTLRDLNRLEGQVKSLFGQNRITADEHDALMKAVQDKRDSIGGKHKRPSGLTSLRRRLAAAPKKTDGPETKAFERLAAAKDVADVVEAIKVADEGFGKGDIDKPRYDGVIAEAARVMDRLRREGKAPEPQTPGAPQKVGPRGDTITPPKDPGAARAAAKGHIDAFREQISDAENLTDVENLMDQLEKIPETEIDKDEFNQIKDMLNAKADRIEVQVQEPALGDEEIGAVNGGAGNPEDPTTSNRTKLTAGYFAKLTPEETEKTPAGKLLAKGKTIEEVEKIDPEGLAEYIHTHPDRFTVKKISGGASGYAFEAHDKVTDKDYFFKTTSNNGKVGMVGDGINEYVAGALGHAAFNAFIPKVEMAGRPEGDKNHVIRMDHLDEFAKANGGGKMDREGHAARGNKIKDPRNPLAIHIFDFLINQTDRHGGNYGVHHTPNGQVIVPVDNGAAFHGYDKFVADQLYDAGYDDAVPGHFLVSPENVSYREWFRFYGPNGAPEGGGWLQKAAPMIKLSKEAYRSKGWGDDKMRDDANAILNEFRKVDMDAIAADLKKRFPKMSEYEQMHLRGAKAIWERRLASIDANDIVRMMKNA